jgi:[acyl-carrier-protein] S-malonyltransferase
MQEAVPVGMGGMCAVMGLSDTAVIHLCQWVEKTSKLKPLEPANFNAPGQVVISGNQKAIEWLQANYKTEDCFKDHAELANIKRVKFIALKVSAPFHCSMMNPAEEKMRLILEDCYFQNAMWPIVQNKSAELVHEANTLRENVIRQISSPVLWTQCVKKFMEAEIAKVIECGSGRVLSGLLSKITEDKIKCLNLNSLEDLKIIESEF